MSGPHKGNFYKNQQEYITSYSVLEIFQKQRISYTIVGKIITKEYLKGGLTKSNIIWYSFYTLT